MHVALLALAAVKPVLAVDRVPGSAKVLSVVGATGWPFLYRADEVELAELERDLLHLEASPIVQEISRAQSRMLELSREARAQGVAALQGLLRQTTGGTKG